MAANHGASVYIAKIQVKVAQVAQPNTQNLDVSPTNPLPQFPSERRPHKRSVRRCRKLAAQQHPHPTATHQTTDTTPLPSRNKIDQHDFKAQHLLPSESIRSAPPILPFSEYHHLTCRPEVLKHGRDLATPLHQGLGAGT